jgi:hypothetical protein
MSATPFGSPNIYKIAALKDVYVSDIYFVPKLTMLVYSPPLFE